MSTEQYLIMQIMNTNQYCTVHIFSVYELVSKINSQIRRKTMEVLNKKNKQSAYISKEKIVSLGFLGSFSQPYMRHLLCHLLRHIIQRL